MILESISSRDLLIDAYKFYLRGDARAHDALTIIVNRDDMRAAVIGCLEKALKEDEPEQQKLYCNAACFGKKFYPGIAIEEFQSVCRSIRTRKVCQCHLPTTSPNPEDNINFLIQRKKYDLALWVSKWNKCKSDGRILTRWCSDLIEMNHLTDEQVGSKIKKVLGQIPPVSYADIANMAIKSNRVQLAISLIENEHQTAKKIPLLISIRQYDLVLAQAAETCDSNSIYSAIFKLRDLIANEVQFLELLKKNRQPFRYYCNFMALTDLRKLIKIQYADGGKEDVLLYILDRNLESALGVSKRAKQDFVTSQIESHIRLNKFRQQTLNSLECTPPPLEKSGQDWNGLSISDTIINLISLGHVSKAKDCQRKFEVPDRKYRVLEQIALNSLPKLELPSSGP